MRYHAIFAATLGLAMAVGAATSSGQTRLQAGSLTCSSESGWGAIFVSKKTFSCVFEPAPGRGLPEEYEAVVRKYGLDIGQTTKSELSWLVFGPGTKFGPEYTPGSLEGEYAGVGAQAAVVRGVGVNALVGGGPDSAALQPVSVQVERGINIAAGVQTMELTYRGPIQPPVSQPENLLPGEIVPPQ